MKMVKVYGISMIEQLKTYPESHNVCAEIGMCYRDQSAGFVSVEDAKSMFDSQSHKKINLIPFTIFFFHPF